MSVQNTLLMLCEHELAKYVEVVLPMKAFYTRHSFEPLPNVKKVRLSDCWIVSRISLAAFGPTQI